MNRVLLLLFICIHIKTVAQGNKEGVYLILKNQCNNMRVSYYDTLLNIYTLKYEGVSSDTIFIEQSNVSSIDGMSLLGIPGSQFGLLTLPGDSLEISCGKDGKFSVRILNKSKFHRVRQQEIDKWSMIVDADFLTKMNQHRKNKDLLNLLTAYNRGHAKRQKDIHILYEGYIDSPFFKSKMALAEFIKYANEFRERFFISNMGIQSINQQVDSLVLLANNPLLTRLPNVYNALAGMLQKITQYNPKYYTAGYWFNYIATSVKPSSLQQQMLLYYIKKTKTPQSYDTLASAYLNLYPDESAQKIMVKYRKLKFLNNNNSASCNIVDTLNSIVSFDSLIAQYKGRPVYVDFWASWCAPCIAEMPQSKKMRNQFSDKVKFIYVSVDNYTEQWHGSIKRNQLQELEHYLLPDGLFIYKGIKIPITSIPRYLIIDKYGGLVDDNAPSPSNKLLSKALESLVR